jgi:uncharacterized protein (TIGR02453 family)
MKLSPLDLEVYPPFDGFPREGIDFLRNLRKNNNRAWFNTHKAEYETFVKLPMQSLVVALQPHVNAFAAEIDFNPKRSIFRIYRDTRFSKDKTPYKTHVAAVFHPRGHWQNSAGYYIHIEPGAMYVGGGMYMPNGDQLRKIRRMIDSKADEFLSIVASPTFERQFKGIEGEKLQRVPHGYAPDHPMAEWLKHKQFYTGVEWSEKECYSAKVVERIASVYKDLYPLIRFLNEALGR